MAGRHPRFSTIQQAAAWTAAYALVLQIMLMSALSASLVGGATSLATSLAASLATPLCLNSVSRSDSDGGAPQKAAAHCPLCLARVDAAVLPPPVPTPEIDRVAIELHYREIVRESLRTVAHRRPQQPRAPPAFA